MCELCQGSPVTMSRRHVMLGAGALFGGDALPFARAWAEQPALKGPLPNVISPEAALERLMQGNNRYAANAPEQKDFSAGRALDMLAP